MLPNFSSTGILPRIFRGNHCEMERHELPFHLILVGLLTYTTTASIGMLLYKSTFGMLCAVEVAPSQK